jgi:hypothetical protein
MANEEGRVQSESGPQGLEMWIVDRVCDRTATQVTMNGSPQRVKVPCGRGPIANLLLRVGLLESAVLMRVVGSIQD